TDETDKTDGADSKDLCFLYLTCLRMEPRYEKALGIPYEESLKRAENDGANTRKFKEKSKYLMDFSGLGIARKSQLMSPQLRLFLPNSSAEQQLFVLVSSSLDFSSHLASSSAAVLAGLISVSRREFFTFGLGFFKLSVTFWLEAFVSGGYGLVGAVGFPGYHRAVPQNGQFPIGNATTYDLNTRCNIIVLMFLFAVVGEGSVWERSKDSEGKDLSDGRCLKVTKLFQASTAVYLDKLQKSVTRIPGQSPDQDPFSLPGQFSDQTPPIKLSRSESSPAPLNLVQYGLVNNTACRASSQDMSSRVVFSRIVSSQDIFAGVFTGYLHRISSQNIFAKYLRRMFSTKCTISE
ncbi:3559_t:CDS:2, partial [Ambispora gerdemannii]